MAEIHVRLSGLFGNKMAEIDKKKWLSQLKQPLWNVVDNYFLRK